MLQYFPRRWIAEELGNIDQDCGKKPINFFRMLAYVLSVLGIAGHAELGRSLQALFVHGGLALSDAADAVGANAGKRLLVAAGGCGVRFRALRLASP